VPAGIGNDANATVGGVSAQIGFDFDTSAIPDANTVTSATFTTSMSGAIYTTAVELYANTASCVTSSSNTNTVWKSPTELGSATLLATDAGGTSSTETFTSTGSFPAAINKTGSTYVTMVVEEQRTRTAGTQKRQDLASPYTSNSYLTIVHNLQAARTVAATLTTAPTVTNVRGYLRAVAATLTVSPSVTRLVSAARTVAVTFGALSTISRNLVLNRILAATTTLLPTVTPVAAFQRTVASLVDASPALTASLGILRTITATVSAVTDVIAGIPAAMLVHKISLRVRSTVTLIVPERVRLTVRSRLRLPE
jgi:hypothetical protein